MQQAITKIIKKEKYFEVYYSNQQVARLYVLSSKMFRFYLDPTKKYGEPVQSEANLNAQILAKGKDAYGTAGLQATAITQDDKGWKLSTGLIDINFDQYTGTMSVSKGNRIILQEAKPVKITAGASTQTLQDATGSYYFGGGTQNGRFNLTGERIKIENTNNWVDHGVASPNPFYWSTNGYGVLRYTFRPGHYDFDSEATGLVSTTHNEARFDAIYFFADSAYELIHDYQELTGLPALTPIYGFYEAHLNAYNRDYWVEVSPDTDRAIKYPDGKYYKEYQPKDLPAEYKDKAIRETLNGEYGGTSYQFSARAMLDQYLAHDMPIGWFLPNDGYGAGYGQTETLKGNIANLRNFVEYANDKGIQVGLWTQQNLSPVDPAKPKPDDRDFEQEIAAGVTALKTDEAWVGNGYSFGLNGTQTAAKMIKKIKGNKLRPFIVTVDGWAGTQNTATVWTGDEVGGEWEYIRFQIPTYIGEGLSGQPNAASDMDGIFGGKNAVVNTRDYQWKAFTPIQLNMDGWGANPKNPFVFADDITAINRAYLKQKSMLLPYIYSIAAEATFAGKPMVRAMFLDYPNEPQAYTDVAKYQYLWGDNFLIAPIYQNTAGDAAGNDIRNGIYLPDKNQVWVDYYTGKQYQGGQVINNFAAPRWKLPVFVKAGAIIPVAPATNTPKEYQNLAKQRQFEIYPFKTSHFKVYEDDGISAQYQEGQYAQTIITSSLQNSTLTINVAKTEGKYTGFEPNKTTEFNLKTNQLPATIAVKVGDQKLQLRQAKDIVDFTESENVFFCDQNYSTNSYLDNMAGAVRQTFLRIKLAATNVGQNTLTVVITGFKENTEIVNQLPVQNADIARPTDLKQDNDKTTENAISISWHPVAKSTSYNLKVDEVLYTNIKKAEFVLVNIKPQSAHTFQVQAVGSAGASKWCPVQTFTAKESILKNTVQLTSVKTTSNIKDIKVWEYNQPVENLFDRDLKTTGHSSWSANKNEQSAIPMTITAQLTEPAILDRFVYVPRNDGKTNGMITAIQIQVSSDGTSWQDAGSASNWAQDNQNKTIKLTTKRRVTKVRFIIPAGGAVKDFVSGNEFLLYKKIKN